MPPRRRTQPAPDSWRAFQETIPGAEIGPMPDNHRPPSFKDTRQVPGREYLDPILWDGDDFREDATNLPEGFERLALPQSYFLLFFDDDILSFLAEKTNAYAAAKRAGTDSTRSRPWYPTCADEMQIWIGINLNRFQQIRRYFHIDDPEQPDLTGDDLGNRPWYHKFEKLASKLREKFHKRFNLGTAGSVDESMAMCTGRTFHTVHIDRKPITDGYKIITLAFSGYVWDFIWWSGSGSGDAGPSDWNEFYQTHHGITSRSALAVLTLCHTLPLELLQFVIFMDNFYTSIKLFALMHDHLKIGACGTVRYGNSIPKEIRALEDPISQRNYQKTVIGSDGRRRRNPIPPPPLTRLEKAQKEWNWLEQVVLPGSVLCWAWRDNGIVTGLSTIHSPDDEFIVKAQRRPKNPNTAVEEAFEELRQQGNSDESLPEFTHREWMEHAAIGMIVDGYQKLKGHTARTSDLPNTVEILAAGRKREARTALKVIDRLHSHVALPAERFEGPPERHYLSRQYGGATCAYQIVVPTTNFVKIGTLRRRVPDTPT
ncbi:hypothetical protein BJ508DRAFT_324399 [Ascobolus immersus RN42]|uniref:PiggyBac transposable element-derived protein domain-containing protein n=1 Tax=Ascobolus immersus RN42 TaxID=1160509 RepID=A0A3N4IG78_ASCIM|nr:hypothetical protein BJ508DRAFT_324399 [Ascobolus immersus RN42]